MSAYVNNPVNLLHRGVLGSQIAIPILLFATVGLFLVLYMHHSWGVVGTVLAHSQVARHMMRSTMLASWILLPLMTVQFYTTTKGMAVAIQENVLFTLFKDIYTLQVTAGYVQFGSILAILLPEAPFFLSSSFAIPWTSTAGSSSSPRLTVVCVTGSESSVTHSVI